MVGTKIRGRGLIAIDESTTIKNHKAKRNESTSEDRADSSSGDCLLVLQLQRVPWTYIHSASSSVLGYSGSIAIMLFKVGTL